MNAFWPRHPAEWDADPLDPPGKRPSTDDIVAVLEWLAVQRRMGRCALLAGVCARPSAPALALVRRRLERHILLNAAPQSSADDAQVAALLLDSMRLRFASAEEGSPSRPLATYTRGAHVAIHGVNQGGMVACWA